MLRASEYLPPLELMGAPPRVLRGRDLEFFRNEDVRCIVFGKPRPLCCSCVRMTFARGQVRTHHLTGNLICPILALREHARCNPQWLTDPTSPVFVFNNRGVTREDVSALLRVCSAALGYPPELMGSHSLRKGGATALFAATGNMELVKRFGGWKSDAVHAYLYADLHGGEQHGTRVLQSKPALQPQQRSESTPVRNRHLAAHDCRAGYNGMDDSSRLCSSPTACPQDDLDCFRSSFGLGTTIALSLSIGVSPVASSFSSFLAMAAEPPAPWTDRRMKDWLPQGNNAWTILGVAPGSDLADVLRSFRRLSIRYHPDKQHHKTENEKAEAARSIS